RVAVVATAGQALRCDGTSFGAYPGLEGVEEREPDRRLEVVVTLDLDVGHAPELVERAPLFDEQPFPTGVPRGVDRCGDLIAQCVVGPERRPAVPEVLHDLETRAGLEFRGHRGPSEVVAAVAGHFETVGPVDVVDHRGRQSDPA